MKQINQCWLNFTSWKLPAERTVTLLKQLQFIIIWMKHLKEYDYQYDGWQNLETAPCCMFDTWWWTCQASGSWSRCSSVEVATCTRSPLLDPGTSTHFYWQWQEWRILHHAGMSRVEWWMDLLRHHHQVLEHCHHLHPPSVWCQWCHCLTQSVSWPPHHWSPPPAGTQPVAIFQMRPKNEQMVGSSWCTDYP